MSQSGPELWRKGFVEKMSFEAGVEERRSNGSSQWWWRKWRSDVCEIRWEWLIRGEENLVSDRRRVRCRERCLCCWTLQFGTDTVDVGDQTTDCCWLGDVMQSSNSDGRTSNSYRTTTRGRPRRRPVHRQIVGIWQLDEEYTWANETKSINHSISDFMSGGLA